MKRSLLSGVMEASLSEVTLNKKEGETIYTTAEEKRGTGGFQERSGQTALLRRCRHGPGLAPVAYLWRSWICSPRASRLAEGSS